MPYCLVFLCIQIDWFCSGALQGSPLHNSIWPPAGAPLGTCSDYRGKGKRWGRELKQHARSQEFPNLSRTLVRLGGSRMAAKWLGAVVPPPRNPCCSSPWLALPGILTLGIFCQEPLFVSPSHPVSSRETCSIHYWSEIQVWVGFHWSLRGLLFLWPWMVNIRRRLGLEHKQNL